MKNNKGFTLIELMAVIVIIGILLMIAIPSVTEYIANSRKSSFIRIGEGYIDGVKAMITSNDLKIKRKDVTYYISMDCIDTENSKEQSPYGEWVEGYVVVTYGEKYNYYWTAYDSENKGVKLTYSESLDENKIDENLDSIDKTIGIGTRPNIRYYEPGTSKCEFKTYYNTSTGLFEEDALATSSIPDGGSL